MWLPTRALLLVGTEDIREGIREDSDSPSAAAGRCLSGAAVPSLFRFAGTRTNLLSLSELCPGVTFGNDEIEKSCSPESELLTQHQNVPF